ncbi:unnamed protein product, partial [Brugia pahangi]|uniref:Ovule protein n=1 Tax=Brugia pahangi TaxID=6280 RepID=A0A0N4T3R5_BRUPA
FEFLCLVCFQHFDSFILQILKPSEKKAKYQYAGLNSGRPITSPQRAAGAATGGIQKKNEITVEGTEDVRRKKFQTSHGRLHFCKVSIGKHFEKNGLP